jgi:hypothetical protein
MTHKNFDLVVSNWRDMYDIPPATHEGIVAEDGTKLPYVWLYPSWTDDPVEKSKWGLGIDDQLGFWFVRKPSGSGIETGMRLTKDGAGRYLRTISARDCLEWAVLYYQHKWSDSPESKRIVSEALEVFEDEQLRDFLARALLNRYVTYTKAEMAAAYQLLADAESKAKNTKEGEKR